MPKYSCSVRFFLQIAFNGSAFHGWQRQVNAQSVQQSIEEALSLLLSQPITITGAGRTDAGVHAHELFAHFDVANEIDSLDLTFRLNRFLPSSIVIRSIRRVTDEAHARFDALSRTYKYTIETTKNPFSVEFAHLIELPLNLPRMNDAAQHLLGTNDFECFSRAHTDVKTFYCTIKSAIFTQVGTQIIFEITADRFLRNMVRAIVGTLLEVGLGKREPVWLNEVIASKSRSEAGASVPAKGLSLVSVEYPKTIWYE